MCLLVKLLVYLKNLSKTFLTNLEKYNDLLLIGVHLMFLGIKHQKTKKYSVNDVLNTIILV
jgi:hypothetical protein